jgi:hypothetical protein
MTGHTRGITRVRREVAINMTAHPHVRSRVMEVLSTEASTMTRILHNTRLIHHTRCTPTHVGESCGLVTTGETAQHTTTPYDWLAGPPRTTTMMSVEDSLQGPVWQMNGIVRHAGVRLRTTLWTMSEGLCHLGVTNHALASRIQSLQCKVLALSYKRVGSLPSTHKHTSCNTHPSNTTINTTLD